MPVALMIPFAVVVALMLAALVAVFVLEGLDA
jgi:hypothetical protein